MSSRFAERAARSSRPSTYSASAPSARRRVAATWCHAPSSSAAALHSSVSSPSCTKSRRVLGLYSVGERKSQPSRFFACRSSRGASGRQWPTPKTAAPVRRHRATPKSGTAATLVRGSHCVPEYALRPDEHAALVPRSRRRARSGGARGAQGSAPTRSSRATFLTRHGAVALIQSEMG